MPCDTIQTNRTQLEAMHPDLRRRALEAMGALHISDVSGSLRFYYRGDWYTLRGTTLESPGNVGATADTLRQYYGNETIRYAAALNGWELQQTGAFEFNVIKQGF